MEKAYRQTVNRMDTLWKWLLHQEDMFDMEQKLGVESFGNGMEGSASGTAAL